MERLIFEVAKLGGMKLVIGVQTHSSVLGRTNVTATWRDEIPLS